MTTLTLEIQSDLWTRLQAMAKQMQESPEGVVLAILSERLGEEGKGTTVPESEGAKVNRVLREAGLLSEIGPYLKHLIETVPVDYAAVEAALERAGGPPLSEIVLAQRCLKSERLLRHQQ